MSDWRPQCLQWPPVKSMCFGNCSHRCFNLWHRRSALVKKHMKVDKVADMKVDLVVDLVVLLLIFTLLTSNTSSLNYCALCFFQD